MPLSRPREARRSWLPVAAAAALAAAATVLVVSRRGYGDRVETPAVPAPQVAHSHTEPIPSLPPQPRREPAVERRVESAVAQPAAVPEESPGPPREPPMDAGGGTAPAAREPGEVPSVPKEEPSRDSVGPAPGATEPAVAVIEAAEGGVWVTARGGRGPAKGGCPLPAGGGLAVAGGKGRAVIRFPDGTRMELGRDSVLGGIMDKAGRGGVGLFVEMSHGMLSIDAAPRPAGRALVVSTPHAEVRVVGTSLRLVVEPGERGSTRVEVREGRVRMAGRSGGAADVAGGHYAVAGGAGGIVVRPLPGAAREIVHRFDFEDGRLPKACRSGFVERGPERGGSRFCVAGAMDPGASCGGRVVLVDDARGLFTFSEDLVACFDYWVDDTVRTLDVQVWNRSQQLTFGATLWNVPRGRWTRAVLPLPEFVRQERGRVQRMRPGDAIITFWIQAGQVGGTLYVDDLEIARIRPALGNHVGR